MAPPAISSPAAWQRAYLDGHPEVTRWHSSPVWQIPQREQGAPLAPAEIAEWKHFLAPHVGADSALLAPIDRLADPRARVVVTGQQAGIAMGPLLCLYKALAARHWAAEHERRTGLPTVAVFWVASDDHDIREAGEVQWSGSDGAPQRWTLAEGRAGHSPMHAEAISEQEAAALLAAVESTTAETEFRPALLDALATALSTGTVEGQFVSLAVRWLLPLGIVPIVPRLNFMRRRAAPLLTRAVAMATDINSAVKQSGEAIAAMGPAAPLHRAGDETNLFVEVGTVRGKLVHDPTTGVYTARDPVSGESLEQWAGTDALVEALAAAPGRFSPNAILRPLVQDAALPTVAYIPGPTELLYHAQVRDVYTMLAVHRPALLPRPNVTLLDARTERALEKLAVNATPELLGNAAAMEQAITNATPRDEATEGLAHQLTEFQQQAQQLVAAGTTITDPAVGKALQKLAEATESGITKVRQRLDHHAATADAARATARARAMNLIFPASTPQERAVSLVAPFMLQHGEGILPQLAAAIDYEHNGFQAIHLTRLG